MKEIENFRSGKREQDSSSIRFKAVQNFKGENYTGDDQTLTRIRFIKKKSFDSQTRLTLPHRNNR